MAEMEVGAGLAETFIAKWRGVTASELSTSQSFLLELCRLLGVPEPHPTPEQNKSSAPSVPGRCSQLGRSSPSTALMMAGAGACLTAASPSRRLPARSPFHARELTLRTGIAAGHHSATNFVVTAQTPPTT